MDAILSFNPTVSITAAAVANSLRLIRATDKLRALLRGLNDKLPLDVTGVLPVSSAFRDTAVFPPVVSVPTAPARDNRSYIPNFSRLNGPQSPVFPLYG
ncbi:unnamed protein product [Echinostoma caproni]|uniref:Nrap_D4 domain-containing protein n=1 Tax=Echinostoma caproni TaxID=27848 RepID=A0A183B9I5_9TREM|nr:unnamed protein product [Echinostoma caproni]